MISTNAEPVPPAYSSDIFIEDTNLDPGSRRPHVPVMVDQVLSMLDLQPGKCQ